MKKRSAQVANSLKYGIATPRRRNGRACPWHATTALRLLTQNRRDHPGPPAPSQGFERGQLVGLWRLPRRL
jgi:hypothetical protein